MTLPYYIFKKKDILDHLKLFSDKTILKYGKMRNFDFGKRSENYVSGLSPAISRRIISEKFVVDYILRKHKRPDVEVFINEVFWRSYWKGYLEHYPQLYADYLNDIVKLSKKKKTEEYESAIIGITQIDCFNYWVHELKTTGYLHNHARMWFASIWIFTLNLPWQLGANFFMQHLLDADIASNTLSWRWVAGLHTKGKNYIAFPGNIKKYTLEKFFPEFKLNVEKKSLRIKREYELIPLTFHEKIEKRDINCVLIHENDLSLSEISHFDYIIIQKEPSPNAARSELVSNYILDCLKDTFMRAKNKYKGKVFILDWFDKISLNIFFDKNNIKDVSIAYPSRGNLKDSIEKLKKELHIQLHYSYSNWDKTIWPHCSKGFFKLKKEIPQILAKVI